MAGRAGRDAEDDPRCAPDRRPTTHAGRVARAIGVCRRSGAPVAAATRRPDRGAGPTGLGRRRRSSRRRAPAVSSVAAPGSTRQVLDLVGLLEAIPFDPQRSPWDVTLIEGLEGGRAALYLRSHHALTDGSPGSVSSVCCSTSRRGRVSRRRRRLARSAPHLAPRCRRPAESGRGDHHHHHRRREIGAPVPRPRQCGA